MILSFIALLLVAAIFPNLGLDIPYLFIIGIALVAWYAIKWEKITSLTSGATTYSMVAAVSLVVLDFALNIVAGSRIGLIDMLVFFVATAIAFYGFKSLRIFWVPVAYGLILLAGYQLENNLPNFTSLQDWMTSIMGYALAFLGIGATTSGHLIYLNSGGSSMILDVESSCTGIHGVIAFGMLSVMALMDIKTRLSRLVPLIVVGLLGAFAINILRLLLVILTFNFAGVSAGITMHLVVGYMLFVLWVVIFWGFSLRYIKLKNVPAKM